MRKIVFALYCSLLHPHPFGRADASNESYTRLLAKYVTPQGVRYAAWHGDAADRAELARVVAAIAKEKPEGSKDEKLAFYLNAYNANILNQVLESYPIEERA